MGGEVVLVHARVLVLEWGPNPQPVGITITLCLAAPRLASHNHIYVLRKILLYYTIQIFPLSSKLQIALKVFSLINGVETLM